MLSHYFQCFSRRKFPSCLYLLKSSSNTSTSTTSGFTHNSFIHTKQVFVVQGMDPTFSWAGCCWTMPRRIYQPAGATCQPSRFTSFGSDQSSIRSGMWVQTKMKTSRMCKQQQFRTNAKMTGGHNEAIFSQEMGWWRWYRIVAQPVKEHSGGLHLKCLSGTLVEQSGHTVIERLKITMGCYQTN